MTQSRHISVSIAASPASAYAYASDPAKLPEWAAGLARSTMQQVGDQWFAASPMGRVRVDFARPNDFGVLDHVVTLPDGAQVLNPMRVLPDGTDCELLFTLRRRPGMSEQHFDDDCAAVAADLERLRGRLEPA